MMQLLPHIELQALNKGRAHRLYSVCNLIDTSFFVHPDPCNPQDQQKVVLLDTITRKRQKSVSYVTLF